MKNHQKLYLVHLSINKLKILKVAKSKENEKDGDEDENEDVDCVDGVGVGVYDEGGVGDSSV